MNSLILRRLLNHFLVELITFPQEALDIQLADNGAQAPLQIAMKINTWSLPVVEKSSDCGRKERTGMRQ